jgi:hypothetical protein
MSRRPTSSGTSSGTPVLPSPADCAVERGISSLVDPTGTGSVGPISSDVLVRLMALGDTGIEGMASNEAIAAALIVDHRIRLKALIEEWRGATLDEPMTQRLSTRANEKAGHAIIELAPSIGRRRLWRVDGAKNDRRRPVLAMGSERSGSGWRVTIEEWPLVSGGAKGASILELATDALGAAELALALLDAHGRVVATGAADDPRCDAVRAVLDGLAHHDASVRARPDDEPSHLRPATIVLAATPWSKASLRHRHPHQGWDARGMRPKLPDKGFVVPGGVTITLTDKALVLSPMRMFVGPNPDPVARLRAIAALSEERP